MAYARMMSLPPPPGLRCPDESHLCGADVFQNGEFRIENAWYAGRSTVRVMIAGGTEAVSISKGCSLRAYQADPEAPGDLKLAGQGVQLPASGPVFHDVELIHPLMPLVLELTDSDDVTGGIALLPFPSLLPGGLHGAELKALQTEANPMDAFWSLSDLLLQECLGRPDWPQRSITSLSAHLAGATGSEPVFSQEVQEWLAAVFGLFLQPNPVAVDADPAEIAPPESLTTGGALRSTLRSRLSTGSASKGLRLLLPVDGLPTISALVSRRLDLDKGTHLTGPFLVTETPSLRPRWSVVLPPDPKPGTNVPVLRSVNRAKRSKGPSKVAPIHLAITMRPADFPHDPRLPQLDASDTNTTGTIPTDPLQLTVILEASDSVRTEMLVQALRGATAEGRLELLVHFRNPDDKVRSILDGICGSEGWTAVSASADLRALAHQAIHEVMLTVSDRVSLDDCRILPALCAILQDNVVASASCHLLAQRIIKKQIVQEPATGGLFPAGVSFASTPRLSFAEPDVRQALPNMIYPVVANTLLLTAWRRRALVDLPRLSGPVPATAADIHIGLDLMEAGYINLCTSQIEARLSGPYLRRDAIDPVGSAYLQPVRWEDLLSRVTVLRELF